MRKIVALTLALLLAVGLMAGCASPSPSATPTDSTGAEATPTPAPTDDGGDEGGEDTPPAAGGGVAIVDLGTEPPKMNSIITTDASAMNVLRHIMEGLTRLDKDDSAIPGIAESWDLSEDGKTYTFHLRQNAKWSNGDPVTAKDFIFAWDTHFNAETAAEYASTWAVFVLGATETLEGATPSAEVQAELDAGGYEGIGYKAVDDYTIQLTLTNPYPFFLSILAFPSFFPVNEAFYTETGADQYATEAEYILTNGPFKLTSWMHESSIMLEKDANYYGADEIQLDGIEFQMITDTGTRLNAYLADEIDMVSLNGDQAAQMRNEGREVITYEDGSVWYFEFNTTIKGLDNAKVRQALTLGLDVESFIENVVKNHSNPAYNYTPAAVNNGEFAAAVGKVIPRSDDYATAKALLEEGLAEAGLTLEQFNAQGISLITGETDTAAKQVAFYQEQWKVNLGVEAQIEQMSFKNRLERMTQKDFTVVVAGWSPDYNDPMSYLDLWLTGGGNNHTSWSNEAYDELIANAMKEVDAAARQQILIEAEQLLMQEMPIGPIYFRAVDYICSDRLKGMVRTTFADMNLRWAYIEE